MLNVVYCVVHNKKCLFFSKFDVAFTGMYDLKCLLKIVHQLYYKYISSAVDQTGCKNK